MLNFITKLILILSLLTGAFASEIDGEILLSLERIKLQNEILYKQYEGLKEIENDIDPKDHDMIIDSIAQKVIDDIESNSKYQKNSAWGEVKELVHHISNEAKVLSRKNGLAISVIIMTIELTEIPMKALAVSIGSPILVVLYEVLQPGILIPTIIIGVQNMAKTAKTKKLFNNKTIYREWKASEKQVRRELGIKKGKNQISYTVGDINYIIDNSNLISDTLRVFGLNKGRIDYKNLKIFMRKRDISTQKITSLMNTSLNKQLKTKLILDELLKLGYEEALQLRFHKAKITLKSRDLDPDLALWVYELLNSHSPEETLYQLENLPLSTNPLIFFELWEAKIMEEFFSFNQHFKRKFYRGLRTELLPIITKLRKEALISGAAPKWSDELLSLSKSYFRSIYN